MMTTIDRASEPRPPLEGRFLLMARILWFAGAAAALAILAAALPTYIAGPKEILNQLQEVGLEVGECRILILLAKSVEYTGGKTEEVSDAQVDRMPANTEKDS